ncbi:MAG: hypothetical protein ACREOF_05715 [Gemmatimonadales bacterium]
MFAESWRYSRGTSTLALLLALVASQSALAQSADPAGQAVVAKAKAAQLDEKRAKKAKIGGRKFDLTPADFSGIKSLDQLKAGVFLGVLETDASAAEDVSLPPGKHELYAAQVNGEWKAYAAKNGKVVKVAKRVTERPTRPRTWTRRSAAGVAAGGCG